ncbi:MAG: Gfo/Idh/MocA family oxidoreductase [Alphaproteobacteria bacterium]|nr:Gfo/Idh/MocA family oxidoreductase [Alphaproteobacteria bacterium]
MNLISLLNARVDQSGPVRVGLIGAGKFGSMFLAQVPFVPGLAVTAIADLAPQRAKASCRAVGWAEELIDSTTFIEDGCELCKRDDIDVVIEATGNPAAGISHALAAIEEGRHIIMVNVEADVLAGPALAKRARSAGVVYSMAYGDQPALVAELVDWARACGFEVAAAGKGTKYLPAFHDVTPDDVWQHYGMTPEEAVAAGMNPQMFNSFLDGTKSAIEMCAISNACDLAVPDDGLAFPPCGVDELAEVLRPQDIGGVLPGDGYVEVVSSLNRDGSEVEGDLRWGVYVVLKARSEYAAACFKQYGLKTDKTGQYASMYKPFHLIGMELGISVLNAALRGEPTGSARVFRGDAVTIAKRDLAAGEMLDGEGGYTVWGKAMPARMSLSAEALPIGLAHGVKVARPVAKGDIVRKVDVELDRASEAIRLRSEAEGLVG